MWKEAQKLRGLSRSATQLLGAEIDLMNISVMLRGKSFNLDRETLKRWLIPISYRLGALDSYVGLKHSEIISRLQNSRYRDFSEQAASLFENPDNPQLDRIDPLIQQYLVHQAFSSLRGIPFHLGVFIAFFILKRAEFGNIRAIIVGKLSGLTAEDTKNNLILW
jgi:vacuolar-type H+-ATPase subunit C/Vma6